MGSTTARNGVLAAADELDNLEAVARLHRRFGPARARKNIPITLDGDPLRLHAQVPKQRGNTEAIRNFLRFAINYDCHAIPLRFQLFRQRGPRIRTHHVAQLVRAVVGSRLDNQGQPALP